MNVKGIIVLGVIAASVAIISGCSSPESSGSSVGSSPGQSVERSQVGVVITLREISLYEDRALLISRPQTQGRSIAQVGGAVLSAMADESTDDHTYQPDAQEITVRVDSGATVVVTQPKAANIQLNQRVKVIHAQQNTRVVAF
jgi:outer membrane lipoprotein SlyB